MIRETSHFMHGCCWSIRWGRLLLHLLLYRFGLNCGGSSYLYYSSLYGGYCRWKDYFSQLGRGGSGVSLTTYTHIWGILEWGYCQSLSIFPWWKVHPDKRRLLGSTLLYWGAYFHYWSVLSGCGCWANVCWKRIRSCWAIMNLLIYRAVSLVIVTAQNVVFVVRRPCGRHFNAE